MPFESLRELSATIKKYELQAWDAERQNSSAMAACFAIVFFTYAALFLPISRISSELQPALVFNSISMVVIGLISLLYSYYLKNKLAENRLHRMPILGFFYHTFVIISIFSLWAMGTSISITPMYIVVICMGFTWLHIVQYLSYITVLLIAILVTINQIDFDAYWFLEFVVVYLFALTLHIFHVSQQCRLFKYQNVIESDRNLDSLTGLLNRRALVENYLSSQAEGKQTAAILVDLDYFKNINDTFGHAAGDQALTYTADIFRRVFRKDDLISRLGGDEFFILLQLGQDAESILKRKVDLLLHQVPLNLTGQDQSVSMTFSVGAYLCKAQEDTTVETMIAKADEAMYRVKQSGRNAALITTSSGSEETLQGLDFPVKIIKL